MYSSQVNHTISLASWFEDLLPTSIKWGSNSEGRTRCPFPDHDDENPSFSVNADKGVYFCHGCKRSGHINDLAFLLQRQPTEYQSITSQKSSKVVKSTKKRWVYENEYIYNSPQNEPHLLVGVNGKGSKKVVHQYHYKNGEWHRGGVQQQYPYRLQDVKHAVKQQKPIYIVEGEKDVLTLRGFHLFATTNAGGAGKWPEDEEFNRFFTGADVILIPDNDDAGKKRVKKIAKVLISRAKTIKVIELPGLSEKEDVTDWLQKYTIQELHSIVERAPYYDEQDDMDGDNFFDEKKQFQPVKLGRYLLGKYPMFFHNGVLYTYDKGVYTSRGEHIVRRTIQRILGDKSRKRYIDETMNWVKTETILDNEKKINPDDTYINVKNGLLNWQTGELHPHSPLRLSTIQVPVNYDPNQQITLIKEFFKSVVPEDTVDTMAELFGYCLVPTTKYHKAFMFTGEGSNGKSTVIDLLTTFIGEDNITNITLQDLEKNRFKVAQLNGKLLNTFADLSYQALETSGMFKSIVSGDRISAEYKGKDAFDFRPFARLVFSANEVPTSRDVSKAFFRRWIIVPFPYTFDSSNPSARPKDPNLLEKLTTEESLSALLNFALDGLRRLEEQGSFTENASTKLALEKYKKESDNVALFLEEMCVQASYALCSTKQLFAEYESWCEESGLKSLGRIRFNKRLQDHIPTLRKKRQFQGPEVWVGIGLLHQN
jgi:putative DNA primase/helicase